MWPAAAPPWTPCAGPTATSWAVPRAPAAATCSVTCWQLCKVATPAGRSISPPPAWGAGRSGDMTTATISVAEAFELCELITRTQARNFYYGIRLLRPHKRAALCAVYALARRIDDIGDGDLPRADKIAALMG